MIEDIKKTPWSKADKLRANMDELRDTLLARLVSGQLRLPEAEKMLEKAAA